MTALPVHMCSDFQASYYCERKHLLAYPFHMTSGSRSTDHGNFRGPCTSTSTINPNLRKVEHKPNMVYVSIFNAL